MGRPASGRPVETRGAMMGSPMPKPHALLPGAATGPGSLHVDDADRALLGRGGYAGAQLLGGLARRDVGPLPPVRHDLGDPEGY